MAEKQHPLARRVEELQGELRTRDPGQLAAQTGTAFHQEPGGEIYFQFPYWQEDIIYSVPEFLACRLQEGDPLMVLDQAMIAYYFHHSQGSPPSQGWIAFSELPDGQFYSQAFQGYTAQKIGSTLGSDYQSFEENCLAQGGEPVQFASLAFRFQVLPQVSVLAACWKGDEDFSPSYQILFNDTASCHLPTDACAILGSMLTGKLLR